MASLQDGDKDEEWFKEVYGKEYTGPTNPRDKLDIKKPKARAPSTTLTNAGETNEEEQISDPNAVPTDFTSREAKVWEAKAKAMERNWKRRKEEELTCRICGETGHFPQGCPSTLGVNKKSNGVVDTIPVQDLRLKPRLIGTGGLVIQSIEKGTGCRLRLEDNHSVGNVAFTIHISGPNRPTVKKAVNFLNDFLHQIENDPKHQNKGEPGSYNVTPSLNPIIAAQMQHVDEPQHNMHFHSEPGRTDSANLNDSRPGKGRYVSHLGGGSPRAMNSLSGSFATLNSPQGIHASSGVNLSSSSNGKSSGMGMDDRGLYNHDQGQDGRMLDRHQDYLHAREQKQGIETGYDAFHLPQTLEELERMFMLETRQLTMGQNVEEDKERAMHHERMREIHGYFQQKLSTLRTRQLQKKDEVLQNQQSNTRQFQQQGYSHHMPPMHGYHGSPLEEQGREDELVYSLGDELHVGGDQQTSGHPYSRKRGAGHSYGKNQAYDSQSYPQDESQHNLAYR